jgi:hypothetical protein
MAVHDDEVEMAKRALPEYLTMAKAGVEVGGLGFPTATLLLAIVDIIGSYHRENSDFRVRVDGHDVGIPGVNEHLRILNSKYFGEPDGLALTGAQINRLYSLVRSRVTHNALVGEGCVLAEGAPLRPAIAEVDGMIWIYLPELWSRVNEAVGRFLAVADTLIPLSAVVREMREKEARFGVTFGAAIAALRELPFGGSMTSVTAIARPSPAQRQFGGP